MYKPLSLSLEKKNILNAWQEKKPTLDCRNKKVIFSH